MSKKKSKWNIQKFIEEENKKAISMLDDLSSVTDEDIENVQFQFAKILDLDLIGTVTAYSEEVFKNTTLMALYDRAHDTIVINPNYFISKDLIYYSIAHELRHKWQNEHDKEEWFENYKSRNKLDLEQYNEQIAEMDANAFALAAMDSLYKGWNTRIKIKLQTNTGIKELVWNEEIQPLYQAMIIRYFNNGGSQSNSHLE